MLSDVKLACPGLFTVAITAARVAGIEEIEKPPRRYDLFIPKIASTGLPFDKTPDYKERLFQRFRFSAIRTYRQKVPTVPVPDNEPPTRHEILDLYQPP